MHIYEVRTRRDKRGIDLISDALPFGRLWNAASRRECSRIRDALQPINRCCSSRLRCGRLRNRIARPRLRFQRLVALGKFTDYSELFAVRLCSALVVRSLSVDPQLALQFAFAAVRRSLPISALCVALPQTPCVPLEIH